MRQPEKFDIWFAGWRVWEIGDWLVAIGCAATLLGILVASKRWRTSNYSDRIFVPEDSAVGVRLLVLGVVWVALGSVVKWQPGLWQVAASALN